MASNREYRGRPGRGGYGFERGRGGGRDERDWTDRAGDEMRSWMGDDEAERRRQMDEERHYGDRDYAGSRGQVAPGAGQADPWWPTPYGVPGIGWGMAGYPYYPPYGGRGYGRGRDRGDGRGFLDKAGDEIASWFGDEEAERRREEDHRGRGPKNYTRSDARIQEDVSERLWEDPHLDASDIEVAVSGGEVTLNGTVESRFAKRHAEDISERAGAVTHVQNNLRVRERGTSYVRPAGTSGAGG